VVPHLFWVGVKEVSMQYRVSKYSNNRSSTILRSLSHRSTGSNTAALCSDCDGGDDDCSGEIRCAECAEVVSVALMTDMTCHLLTACSSSLFHLEFVAATHVTTRRLGESAKA